MRECPPLWPLVDMGLVGLLWCPVKSKGYVHFRKTLREVNIPLVFVDRKVRDFEADSVVVNDYETMLALTRHLISLGHRKIGLLSGQMYVSSARERLAGFQSAMREIGVVVDDYPYIYKGSFNRISSGVEGTKYLYELGATAIISANNLLAQGALQYCHSAKIRVPEDLSLCSFGTIANHELLYVQPTYAEQAPDSMGARLAELIIERIEAKNQLANRELRFSVNLVTGNGTAAPKEEVSE